MGRGKAAQRSAIAWYLSANADNKEGRFIQVGNSLLLSKRFQELSDGARTLYFCMAMEAGGKSELEFPASCFAKYGIPERSARRRIQELVTKGFISRDSGWTVRQPNKYKFLPWKAEKSG